MSKYYTKKQRRRDDRIILFIYGLIIVAFLSVIFSAWWGVFRTTRYYYVPYPVDVPAYSECRMKRGNMHADETEKALPISRLPESMRVRRLLRDAS